LKEELIISEENEEDFNRKTPRIIDSDDENHMKED